MPEDSQRIVPIPGDQFTDEQAEVAHGRHHPWCRLNFVGVLIQNPTLYQQYIPFGERLMAGSNLPPREREVLILRTCRACDADYETAHHRLWAHDIGMSDEDIDSALGDGSRLSDFERMLMRAADELVATQNLTDDTWSALAARYSPLLMIELVYTVAGFTMIAMVTNSMRIEPEKDIDRIHIDLVKLMSGS